MTARGEWTARMKSVPCVASVRMRFHLRHMILATAALCRLGLGTMLRYDRYVVQRR